MNKKYVIHENGWYWGRSVTVITSDASGFMELSFAKSDPYVCFLSGLSVIPQERRKHIATDLLIWAIEYCERQGIFRIDLESVKEEYVLDFYKKFGFQVISEETDYFRMFRVVQQQENPF